MTVYIFLYQNVYLKGDVFLFLKAYRAKNCIKCSKRLTRSRVLVIVRRFREYPERVVVYSRRAVMCKKDPRKQVNCVCATLDTRDSSQCTPVFGMGCGVLRPIAIVPATPTSRMGYAGRDSETESAHPLN